MYDILAVLFVCSGRLYKIMNEQLQLLTGQITTTKVACHCKCFCEPDVYKRCSHRYLRVNIYSIIIYLPYDNLIHVIGKASL